MRLLKRLAVTGMVIFSGLCLLTTALPVSTAEARSAAYATPYCAREFDGATDCSYFTLRQCLAAVSATGGDCAVNPRYGWEPRPQPRRAQRNIR